jgi:hypothetical protein
MKFHTLLAGVSKRVHIGNGIIRSQLGETSIMEDIKRYRQQWRDHLLRMDNTSVPNIANCYKREGRRDVGRPELKWTNS